MRTASHERNGMAKLTPAQILGRAGGKKRWKSKTKKQRSDAMRALAVKRHGAVNIPLWNRRMRTRMSGGVGAGG